jgi:hypothetical protein
VGVNLTNHQKSGIVRFPTGETVRRFQLGNQSVRPTANPDLFLVSPIKDYEVAVLKGSTGMLVMGNKTGALDADAKTYVTERVDGELAIFEQGKSELDPIARITLPRSRIAGLESFAISDDFHYLAVANRSRGAIYDLKSGDRLFHVRSFSGGAIKNGNFRAYFPKTDDQDAQLATVDLAGKAFRSSTKITTLSASQVGRFVVEMDQPNKKKNETIMTVKNADDMTILWSKTLTDSGSYFTLRSLFLRFLQVPDVVYSAHNESVVFCYRAREDRAKNIIKLNPVLKAHYDKLDGKSRDWAYVLEAVDLANGASLGEVLLDTGAGSFIPQMFVAGHERLVVRDNKHRALVYSLKTGDVLGRIFSDGLWYSEKAGMLIGQSADKELAQFDLQTFTPKRTFTFKQRVAAGDFDSAGNHLAVLTDDQSVYVLDLTVTVQ